MKINKNNILVGVMASTLFLVSCSKDEEIFSPQEQFETDIETISQYLEDNNIDAKVDPNNGIFYTVHDQGTGLQPYVNDSVTISYTGTVLSNGTQFGQAENQKSPLASLITGLQIALNKIQEGGSMTVYLPSFYGFRNTATDLVPANSVLVFDLEFHEYHAEQIKKDVQIIDDSLAAWGIEPEIHPSGIRYVLDQGTGDQPSSQSSVTVNYSGRLLGSPTTFDSGVSSNFSLPQLVVGWQIILPLVKEGGSITMYLPSSLGYGRSGSGQSIPPNSNLVFDVSLLDVR